MPSNSRRKYKKLKVTAGESITIVEGLMDLLSQHGIPVSLPCHVLPAISQIVATGQIVQGPAPQGTRRQVASGAQVAPVKAGAVEGLPMDPNEMKRLYEEKLSRTMKLAEETGVRVDANGNRIAAPGRRKASSPSDQEPLAQEEKKTFDGFENDDETDAEEETVVDQGQDSRVNAKTGKSLAEQRAIIERITGKRPTPPTPGAVNPKAIGG